MARRHLDKSEAEGALRAGKAVECFIGPCTGRGMAGIRWIYIRQTRDTGRFEVSRFDTADLGSPEFTDLYEFGPLNDALELEEADETFWRESFEELWAECERRYPGSSSRLVNEGMIQDEYADFLAQRNAV